MIKVKELNVPVNKEVRSEVVETIINRMGISKAAFVFRETMSQKVDYLKTREKLFNGKTAGMLYAEIKKAKSKR